LRPRARAEPRRVAVGGGDDRTEHRICNCRARPSGTRRPASSASPRRKLRMSARPVTLAPPIGEGLGTPEIATRLGISHETGNARN
jgi:hypothetical protein